MLKCCEDGGCWRARTKPLGDGDAKDEEGQFCVDVAGDLPRCMDLIRAEDVIRAIEGYFAGGALDWLTAEQLRGRLRDFQPRHG